MKVSLGIQPITIALTLAVASIRARAAQVGKLPASPVNTFDDAASCKDLPDVLQKLLLLGYASDGVPLQLSDEYSVHYPAGSNPTAKELYATIPATSFGPTDDPEGAISGSTGFDKKDAIADQGYGEEAHASYSSEGGLPSFCRVGGMVNTTATGNNRAHFEVWLPLADAPHAPDVRPEEAIAEDLEVGAESPIHLAKAGFKRACVHGWTKRLVFMIGGGMRGTVTFPELKQTLSRYRVAVAGSNGGHFSAQDGTHWVPNNPDGWVDYSHRAVHISTQVAQLAVSVFYDAQPNSQKPKSHAHVSPQSSSKPLFYSYFKGCSTGGRAAMAEAQRYPHDYDGILAGSPAFDFNHLKAYQVHVNTFLANNKSEGYFPTEAYPLIHKAVLDACDAQDGVADGVVSDPSVCKPDFAKLIGCKSLGITPGTEKEGNGDDTKMTKPAIGGVAAVGAAVAPIAPVAPAAPVAPGARVALVDPVEQVKVPVARLVRRRVTSEPPTDPSNPTVNAVELVSNGDDVKKPTVKDPSAQVIAPKEAVEKAAKAEASGGADKEPAVSAPDAAQSAVKEPAGQGATDKAPKIPAPKCLTDAQLETLQSIYTDYTIDNKLIREAVLVGSEYGWQATNAITGKFGASPSSWFHYQVLGDKVWDDKAFNASLQVTPELIEQGERTDPGETITFNPDLGEFFDAGGKLMHYHGLADALVPPLVSSRYYELVKSKVGEDKTRENYRLYMIPGLLHCRGGTGCANFGGAGQYAPGSRPLRYDDKHDLLLALFSWVEKGQVPNTLIGAAYNGKAGGAPKDYKDETAFANGVRFTRPLCAYPTKARLSGNARADTSDASAFECA